METTILEINKDALEYFTKVISRGEVICEYRQWIQYEENKTTERARHFRELQRATYQPVYTVLQQILQGYTELKEKTPKLYTVIISTVSDNPNAPYIFVDRTGNIDWTSIRSSIAVFTEEQLDRIPKWATEYIKEVK